LGLTENGRNEAMMLSERLQKVVLDETGSVAPAVDSDDFEPWLQDLKQRRRSLYEEVSDEVESVIMGKEL
jgi:hypothetical protein